MWRKPALSLAAKWAQDKKSHVARRRYGIRLLGRFQSKNAFLLAMLIFGI